VALMMKTRTYEGYGEDSEVVASASIGRSTPAVSAANLVPITAHQITATPGSPCPVRSIKLL
jgi:hypothetical protein